MGSRSTLFQNRSLIAQGFGIGLILSLIPGGAAPFTVSAAQIPQPSELPDPGALIRYEFEKDELTRLCDQAIEAAQAGLSEVAALAPDTRTVENTLLVLEGTLADFGDKAYPLTFMGYASPNEEISAEGSACEEKVSQFFVGAYTRKDLYDAIKDQKGRSADEERLLSETLKNFERNGLKLPEEKLAKVKELKSKLAVLESQFSTNLNNDRSSVVFTAAELEGVSSSFLERLKKTDDGKYIVTTKGADYTHVAENAKSDETRKRMLFAYNNRASDKNPALIEEAILIRQQIASELGFKTWADARMQGRMAKDSDTALAFLSDLKAKLEPRKNQDLAKLLKFKQELTPDATDIKAWDINYLSYQLKKRDYSLDDEKIREYFPADTVVRGMFEVYSKVLGVDYQQIQNAKVWHPDVKLYAVIRRADQKVISYFYADFFPRPGKYGHAAAFPLISGRILDSGEYSQPVAAVLSNFNPPSGDKPALLNHSEVETLFHEFGHIMHQILTRGAYASLSGTNVAQDFVEAPSQMLEEWVWSSDILSSISGHYQDPSRKLPAELLAKMIEAKNFNQGYLYTRQLLFGFLDMTFHTTQGPVKTSETYDRLYREIIGVENIEGTHFPANFGHLMGGYDAGYYGYLWSEVYAADLFTRFEKDGLLSPEAGADYRRHILEQGNMKDSLDLIRDFLGREPNSDAFFKKLGVTG